MYQVGGRQAADEIKAAAVSYFWAVAMRTAPGLGEVTVHRLIVGVCCWYRQQQGDIAEHGGQQDTESDQKNNQLFVEHELILRSIAMELNRRPESSKPMTARLQTEREINRIIALVER